MKNKFDNESLQTVCVSTAAVLFALTTLSVEKNIPKQSGIENDGSKIIILCESTCFSGAGKTKV